MAGLANSVLGGLADKVIPIIQTPVEDIVYEVLDQKGLPTRAEVRDIRGRLERLEKVLGDLTTVVEGLRRECSEAIVAAQNAVPTTAAAPRPQAPTGADPSGDEGAVESTGGRHCRVDGCTGALRAKGFCAKHYQQWKRNNLDGFVAPDGTTEDGAVRYRVDAEAAGQVVQTHYDGDEIIFFLPETGRTLRLKVADVRVDD